MTCELTTDIREDGRFDHRCQSCGGLYVSRSERLIVECESDSVVPCVHRGEAMRTVPYELCGCDGRTEQVLQCNVHGECTMRKYQVGQAVKNCIDCLERSAG